MMSSSVSLGVGAFVLVLVAPLGAHGQERNYTYFESRLRAPKEALELGVSAGYAQGIGFLRDGAATKVSTVSGPGLGIGGQIGYRMSPAVSLAITGEYGELDGRRGNSARTFAPGVEATLHLAPYRRVDPWIAAGAGYRLFWDVDTTPGTTNLTHGFRLGRLALGLDMRMSDAVAVGPMVGADVNMMLWDRGQDGSSRAIPNQDLAVSTFFFGGIQGRFDIARRFSRDPDEAPSTARR